MKLSGLLLGLGIVAAIAALLLEPWHRCGRHEAWTSISLSRGFCRSGEWSFPASLYTIAVAHVDFRGNDRDSSKVNDFWTADVGLNAPADERSVEFLRLIEISIADAQGRRTPTWMLRLMRWFETPAPRSGWEIIN